jgi:hypothetical protein
VTGYQTGPKLWTGGGVAAAVEDYDASCDTEFGPQISEQAWSVGAQPPEPTHPHVRHAWTTVLRAAGIGTGLAVAFAALVLLCGAVFGHPDDDHNSWPPGYTNPPVPVVETPIVMPPWPPPPVSDAQGITQDGDYLHRLRMANLIGDLSPSQAAINVQYAQAVCRNLARGFTFHQIAVYDHDTHPDERWTVQEDEQWGHIAAAVYCPEVAR